MKKELNIVTTKLNLSITIQSKDLVTNAVMNDIPEINNILHVFANELEESLRDFEIKYCDVIDNVGK